MLKNSLYKDYIESNTPNRKVIELGDKGFIEYEVEKNNEVIYIWNLYVRPSERGESLVRDLEKLVINRENPKVLLCDVQLDWKNKEHSLGVILHGGYKIHKVSETQITLIKHLE